MARRSTNVFSLSFLDAMTCGFGAVVLFFMVINASSGIQADAVTLDLQGEVDRLEIEVLEGYKDLVEVRNSVRDVTDRTVTARGLAARLLERIEAIRQELATFDDTTLASQEHVKRLKTDLKALEEDAKRLSAMAPSDEMPGARVRTFFGDGDRQYLTGLKVGGRRVLILVDASASMLDDTIVNVIRRRLLPDDVKIRADKWQQAVATVDWVSTQLPRDSKFQIHTFNTTAGAVVDGTDGRWLDAGDRETLDGAVQALKGVVPDGGTSLYHGFQSIDSLNPPPDNLILLVDGLPTQGKTPPRGRTVSGKQRAKLFERAVRELHPGMPVNVILFPMEGDPDAASAYWKLALRTRGSFLSPSRDWP